MATVTHSGFPLTVYTSNLPADPDKPWTTVISRFDQTYALAMQFKELLVGADGQSGYMGALQEAVDSAPVVNITPQAVDTTVSLRTIGSKPTFDHGSLVTPPSEVYTDPEFLPLPIVDTDSLTLGTKPSDIDPSVAWSSTGYTSDVYASIVAKILADLTNGSTGLESSVEQAIFDRAIARAADENAAQYTKLDADLRARRFSMPSGALAASLVDFNNGVVKQNTDTNNQIIITQADLAQKNQQFVVSQAIAIEQLLRGTYSDKENRELDKAKSVADLLVREYIAAWEGYKIDAEAKKTLVGAQAENLKAVGEANKNLVELFKGKYEALATRIEAATAHNKSITDVFTAEMQGFSEEARAYSAEGELLISGVKMKIEAARMDLEAQIQEAQVLLQGYVSLNSLREKISNDQAQIAQQAMASTLNSVNANASLGYSASESKSDSMSQSVSISENHEVKEDPV